MHVLATQLATLEEADVAVDLGQSPAEVVVLSFSDSDLVGAGGRLAARLRRPADPAGSPASSACAIRCRSTSMSTASLRAPRS
jgi:hypothetical protein